MPFKATVRVYSNKTWNTLSFAYYDTGSLRECCVQYSKCDINLFCKQGGDGSTCVCMKMVMGCDGVRFPIPFCIRSFRCDDQSLSLSTLLPAICVSSLPSRKCNGKCNEWWYTVGSVVNAWRRYLSHFGLHIFLVFIRSHCTKYKLIYIHVFLSHAFNHLVLTNLRRTLW